MVRLVFPCFPYILQPGPPIEKATLPESRATLKRSRSPSEEAAFHRVPAGEREETGDEDDTYGRSHFGAWGEYMRRKRAKLQIQNNAGES